MSCDFFIEFLTVGMENKNENVQDLSYIDTITLITLPRPGGGSSVK